MSPSGNATARLLDMLQTAFGPQVCHLLEDDDVTEIMANPDGRVWVERTGKGLCPTDIAVRPDAVERVIRLVASSIGVVCNRQKPTLSAILPDSGARFQGMLPDVVPAPAFVIRRRATRVFTLPDYVQDGILSKHRARQIWLAVKNRKNILIVGGTGTGKTTFANAVLQVISETGHRIVTIEDTPELQCTAPNHLPFYVRDDVGFTWQRAVKDALRVRPDRIVVGEVRDGSALDLLKAWNTGHNGGCATIHANSARRGLTRMESLIEEVAHHPPRELIAEAVDLIVHIRRTNGGRKIDEVVHVHRWDGSDYVLEPIPEEEPS